MAILIFEKSAEVSKRIIELVKEAGTGMEIYSADSFATAVSLLQEKKFKAALLDLNFGGNFSLELLQLIKKINHDTIAIMMYTHADESRIQECRANEADYIFDKYNDFEMIPGVICSLV